MFVDGDKVEISGARTYSGVIVGKGTTGDGTNSLWIVQITDGSIPNNMYKFSCITFPEYKIKKV